MRVSGGKRPGRLHLCRSVMAGALARSHVGGACGNPLCIDDTRRVYPSRALLRQDAANTPVLFGFGRRRRRGWRVPVHRGNIDFASLTIPVLHGLGSIPWRSRVSAAALDDASRSAPKARSAGAVWRTGGAAHDPSEEDVETESLVVDGVLRSHSAKRER